MNNPRIKADPLAVSESVLLDAGNAIRERNKEHGHTERSFKMIGTVEYLHHPRLHQPR